MQENENKSSYLPLFRKYRPQSFKDVIGQEFTTRALCNAIKLNKIANAYLFCGPRGTGKTSCARIFAKSLNCIEGPTVEPCQKCQSCLDVTNASGLDVIEIDAATNRGIDDAKELISKVQYAPMNGKYKIFIIDEVHMLSKEAFNALLKTFEEPPKNVIFILATTEPHKVIETIVSRCQRFDFKRITTEDITKRLREISDKEGIKITDDALYTIAKNVSGGMRDSLALLDQSSILGFEKEITKETIETLMGKLTFDVLFDLCNSILNKDTKEATKKVREIFEKGIEPRNFIENFIEFLRNAILTSNSDSTDEIQNLTLFTKENISQIKSNDKFIKAELINILDTLIEFYKEVKSSTNPYLWAELGIISATGLKKETYGIEPPNKTAKYNIESPNKTVSQKKETYNIEPPNKTAKIKEDENKNQEAFRIDTKPVIEDIEDKKEDKNINNENLSKPEQKETISPSKVWAEILNGVDSIPAKFFYSGVGKLVSIENTKITLGFVNENAITQAKSENKYNPLLRAIKNVLGENGTIDFITVTKDTKIIDTKLNVSIAKPQKNIESYRDKKEKNSIKEDKLPPSSDNLQAEDTIDKDEDNISDENDKEIYTEETKNMLETYSGRIIE